MVIPKVLYALLGCFLVAGCNPQPAKADPNKATSEKDVFPPPDNSPEGSSS